MRKLVYDFALTVDGFISHRDGSIDGFLGDGEHLPDYQERLAGYDTVVMGRNTYEFGYRFGLTPGERAYPHMDHYIFSRTLRFESGEVTVVDRGELAVVRELKAAEGTDIYLCGGGAFAGFLLEHELIDQLVIKLNPVVFGGGIRAFGDSSKHVRLELVESGSYANGVVLLRYDLDYRASGA